MTVWTERTQTINLDDIAILESDFKQTIIYDTSTPLKNKITKYSNQTTDRNKYKKFEKVWASTILHDSDSIELHGKEWNIRKIVAYPRKTKNFKFIAWRQRYLTGTC